MPRRKLTQGDRIIRWMLELAAEQEGVELELPPRTIDPPADFDLIDPQERTDRSSHPPRT